MRRSALLAIVAALLVSASTASLAAAAPSPLRISAPRQDQLIPAGKGAVAVRVLAPPGSKVTAELRRVGSRKRIAVPLSRSGDGALVGRLRRGTLVAGRNHLFVSARAGGHELVRSAHFTLGHRHRMLRLRGLSRQVTASVRVTARMRGATDVVARLNGRGVSAAFAGAGQRRTATLAADDGLRFGRNRLVVTAFDRYGGGYQRLSRSFAIGRGRPLVGAGPDRVGDTGARIRFDGSSTVAGSGALRMRWRIARAPRGSKAHLRGAGGKRPLLVGAKAGVYRLRLTASQGPAAPGATASSAAAAASATDTVSACVQPDVLPEGVPVETIGSGAVPAVTVGAASYPMANPAQSFAQLVVLDRCSLELVSNTSYGPGPAAIDQLAEAVEQLPNSDLAIVSGGGVATQLGGQPAFTALYGALVGIGAEFGAGAGEFSAVEAGEFSVVGIPGLHPGQATQLVGGGRGGSAPHGGIRGLLQLDVTETGFTFNWPRELVPFELGAAEPGATRNTISVDGSEYAEELKGEAGFHLLWVEPSTLRVLGQETVAVGGVGLNTLAARLRAAEDAGALIFLSSYGQPNFERLKATPSAPEVQYASEVAQLLSGFGANRYAFAGLAGNGGYSFVGIAGATELRGPNSGVELIQGLAKTKTARISGELARTDQGSWFPSASGSPEGSGAEPLGRSLLTELLAQPPHPFEPLESDPEMAAQRYILAQLGVGGKKHPLALDPTFGIRRLYWMGGSAFDAALFGELAGKLKTIEPCRAPKACARNFPAVRKQLESEFVKVKKVKEFFTNTAEPGNLARILNLAESSSSLSFSAIGKSIESFYVIPPGSVRAESADDYITGALDIGQGVANVIPVVGNALGGGLAVTEGAVEIAEGIEAEGSGAPASYIGEFEGDALEWASALEAHQKDARAALAASAKFFLGDEGRLDSLYENFTVPASEGGLDFSTAEVELISAAIERSQARFLWSTMLPLPARATLPFHEPFASPLEPGDRAFGEGVYEVNVPTGTGSGSSIRFGSDIAPVSVVGAVGLLEAKVVARLFGPVEDTGSFSLDEPLGFVPEFFLSPASELNDGSLSPGFAAKEYCRYDPIPDWENSETRVEPLTGKTERIIPCSEP